MAARRANSSDAPRPNRAPARTPEAREQQLVATAIDLAERQMQEGTASAQVITHFLKLGSSREHLEQLRLEKENELLDAKREAMASAARVEELYKSALDSMRAYSGQAPLEMVDEDFDD